MFEHDMVDCSHIGSEVKSDSINRKTITYLVGNDTFTLFLLCLIPKLKHVRTFDMVDMSGGHFEFDQICFHGHAKYS